MTWDEYFNLRLKEEINSHKDEILNTFKNHLNKHKEKLIIARKNYTLDSILKFKNSPDDFFQNNLISIYDESIQLPLIKELKEIVKEELSHEIKELKCPEELLQEINLLDYQNLEKLSLTKLKDKITKQKLEFLLGQTNIKDFSIEGNTFDEEILKDSIFVTDGHLVSELESQFTGEEIGTKSDCLTGLYHGKKIEKKPPIFSSTQNKVYCKDPYQDCDKMFNLISGLKDTSNSFKIYSDMEKPYQREQIDNYIINYFNNRLELGGMKNIKEIELFLNSMKEHEYDLNKIELHLENKSYEDVSYLRNIEQKYPIKIHYSNISECNAEEFITMRATLNYYKELILESDLSPLEKVTYAYDLIKSFYYEAEDSEKEDVLTSRTIHNIIQSGKIVCAGYATFFAELMKEVGVEGYTFVTCVPNEDSKLPNHERTILKIEDDKYGVHGSFAFDPTWDSAGDVAKIIDENGNETYRRLYHHEPLKEGETLIKTFDNLSLYHHFLISNENYQKVFEGEEMPKLDSFSQVYADNVSSEAMKKDEILSNTNFDLSKFKELIIKVRLEEGYSKETIEETLNDILEVNGYQKEEKQKKL